MCVFDETHLRCVLLRYLPYVQIVYYKLLCTCQSYIRYYERLIFIQLIINCYLDILRISKKWNCQSTIRLSNVDIIEPTARLAIIHVAQHDIGLKDRYKGDIQIIASHALSPRIASQHLSLSLSLPLGTRASLDFYSYITYYNHHPRARCIINSFNPPRNAAGCMYVYILAHILRAFGASFICGVARGRGENPR